MATDEWKEHLKELGWSYWKDCNSCGGAKKYYRRDKQVMLVRPSRNFYSFVENGRTKAGKLSELGKVVEAAKQKVK